MCDQSEPVAYSLVFKEWYGVNAETTFKTRRGAEAYAKLCSGNPRVVPLYAHPTPSSPSEREQRA